jgi:hypothetical protein
MVAFSWLHLTDLHLGMDDKRGLWYDVQDSFFNDLRVLLETQRILGDEPLDLVLFTGDFVYSGKSAQFEQVNKVLERLRAELEQMGYDKLPKLLAVPGNHDLVRPPKSTEDNPNMVLDALLHLWDNNDCAHVQSAFWSKPESPQRRIVNEAFKNYLEWRQGDTPLPQPKIQEGILPGDFSTTITKKDEEGNEVKLGIVGLNSAFLQLVGGNREGKLALDRGQFNQACGGDGSYWAKEHNACLLLTHHPPNWLTDTAKEHLDGSIHRLAERFALHIFGHMHSSNLTRLVGSNGHFRNRLQGCSLLGLNEWEWGKESEEGESQQRSHGYSIGQLKIDESQLKNDNGTARLRIWPREAPEDKDWVMFPALNHPGIDPQGRATISVPIATKLLPPQLIEPSPNGEASEHSTDQVEDGSEDPNKFKDIDPTIDPILLPRLDALQRNLCRIPVWLAADLETLEVRPRSRKEWERSNLADKVDEHLQALDRLFELLNREDPIDDETIREVWQEYAKISHASRDLFGEYLDPIGGLSIREEAPTREIADMHDVAGEFVRVCATKYVKSTWLDFFAVPARQEAFNKAIARVVRLRFPKWTIWSLPLAAHEVGHVVIEENLADFIDEQARKWSREPDDVNEVLADFFATHMIGPAYVCAAISLRLDPSAASDNGRLTDDERAKAMLTVLKKQMKSPITLKLANNGASDDVDEPSNSGISIIDLLSGQWENMRLRATSLEEPAGREVGDLAKEASRNVRWSLRTSGRYLEVSVGGLANAETWAQAWSNELEELRDGSQELSVPKVEPGSTLRDALNAAWLCRLQRKPDEINLIASAAEELCKRIIEGRKDPPGHRSEQSDPALGPHTQ